MHEKSCSKNYALLHNFCKGTHVEVVQVSQGLYSDVKGAGEHRDSSASLPEALPDLGPAVVLHNSFIK